MGLHSRAAAAAEMLSSPVGGSPPRPSSTEALPTMAKRSRGSANRPGQRRPTQRPASRPAPSRAQTIETRRPDSVTAEEEARAAELEAGILAEERAAELGRARSRERARPAYTP